jgi:hypothetical protein
VTGRRLARRSVFALRLPKSNMVIILGRRSRTIGHEASCPHAERHYGGTTLSPPSDTAKDHPDLTPRGPDSRKDRSRSARRNPPRRPPAIPRPSRRSFPTLTRELSVTLQDDSLILDCSRVFVMLRRSDVMLAAHQTPARPIETAVTKSSPKSHFAK